MEVPARPHRLDRLEVAFVDLAGVRYAMLPASELAALAVRAGVELLVHGTGREIPPAMALRDKPVAFPPRLAGRRRRAGLTQKELARRAGIRVETLNRLERGHTNPDFLTVRKLVNALREAERGAASAASASSSPFTNGGNT